MQLFNSSETPLNSSGTATGWEDAPRLSCLDVSTGKTLPEVVINKSKFIIGRHNDSDLHLDHAQVSKNHAYIERRGNSYYLTDNSRNGTRWNTQRLDNTESRLLAHEDVITICDSDCYRLTFWWPVSKPLEPETETEPALMRFQRISVRLDTAEFLYRYQIYKYSIILLHGVAGGGKSHLLRALTNSTLQDYLYDKEPNQRYNYKYELKWQTRPTLLHLEAASELKEFNLRDLVGRMLALMLKKLGHFDSFDTVQTKDLRLRWENLAAKAKAGSDEEALRLLRKACTDWLTETKTSVIFLVDDCDKLLENIPLLLWRELGQTIKDLAGANNKLRVSMILAGRFSQKIWLEHLLDRDARRDRNRLDSELRGLRDFDWEFMALEKLKPSEAHLLENYSLIEAGGGTANNRIESAFGYAPQGCYRNGNRMDKTTFEFLAARLKPLAGQHARLTQAIAKYFIQRLVPPLQSNGVSDLTWLTDNLQSKVALIKDLLTDPEVVRTCQEIAASLTSEQQTALAALSRTTGRNYQEEQSQADTTHEIALAYHSSRFDWTGYIVEGLAFEGGNKAYPDIFSPVFGLYLLGKTQAPPPPPVTQQPVLPPVADRPSVSQPNSEPMDVLTMVRQQFTQQKQKCWLTVDVGRQAVSICGYPSLQLTGENWRLFYYFYTHPYVVIPKEDLILHIYNDSSSGADYYGGFDAILKRLREKIEPWRGKNMVFIINKHNAFEFRPGQPPTA